MTNCLFPSQNAGMTLVRPPFGERNSARSVTLAYGLEWAAASSAGISMRISHGLWTGADAHGSSAAADGSVVSAKRIEAGSRMSL